MVHDIIRIHLLVKTKLNLFDTLSLAVKDSRKVRQVRQVTNRIDWVFILHQTSKSMSLN